MEDSDISYILKSPIGTLLCKGFAALFNSQPQFPVSFLANWLLQQSKSQTSLSKLSEDQNIKSQKTSQLSMLRQQKQDLIDKREVQPSLPDKLQNLRRSMEQSLFKSDLVAESLPNFIRDQEGVGACYIAELKPPRKRIEEEDQFVDDLDADKVLVYIGASTNNQKLMMGKVLAPPNGVSWDLFKEEHGEEEPKEDGSQQLNLGQRQSLKKVFVLDVLKESRMHYFRLPKLGSYLCFLWPVQSYLVEQAFDKGAQKEREHAQIVEELKKSHQEKILEMKAELEERQTKDNYSEDQNYLNLKLEFQALVGSLLVLPELQFPFEKRVFVVGCDSLGIDTQISRDKQDNIQNILHQFKKEWESSQRKGLLYDLDVFAKYSANIQADVDKINQQLQVEAHNQAQRVADKALSERQLKYETDEAKLRHLKKHLLEKGSTYLQTYGTYSISKFTELLRDIFMFAGHESKDTDKSHKQLDWRRVRHLVQHLSSKVLELTQNIDDRLSPQRQEQFRRLLKKMERYDYEAVGAYNVGLWLLSQAVKKHLELTLLATQLFKEKKEAFLSERQKRLEEKQKILEDRAKALEDYVSTLEAEAQQSFNESQWLVNYDTEHPIPTIDDVPEEYREEGQEYQVEDPNAEGELEGQNDNQKSEPQKQGQLEQAREQVEGQPDKVKIIEQELGESQNVDQQIVVGQDQQKEPVSLDNQQEVADSGPQPIAEIQPVGPQQDQQPESVPATPTQQ